MKKLPPVSRAWRPIEAHNFLERIITPPVPFDKDIDEAIDVITGNGYHADMSYKKFYALRASLSHEDVTALATLLAFKAAEDLFHAERLEAYALDKFAVK